MFLERGLIDEFQLNSALSHQRNCGGGRLGDSLVTLRYITEEERQSFLAEQLNLLRIDPVRRRISAETLACIPAEKAWELKAVPVDRREMNGTVHLLVAMADPTDGAAIDALQLVSGCLVRPALALESAVAEALVNHYGPLVAEEDDLFFGTGAFDREEDSGAAAGGLPSSTGEKYRQLLKILLDKGILSLREYEKLK